MRLPASRTTNATDRGLIRLGRRSRRRSWMEPLTGRQLVADPAGRLGVDANPHAGPIQGSRQ